MKTTCLDAVKKACNQGPATENFPENYYPSKIPNLREKIKETINKAKEDCSQRVSHFLTFPNVDQEESEMYQDDIMMEHICFLDSQSNTLSQVVALMQKRKKVRMIWRMWMIEHLLMITRYVERCFFQFAYCYKKFCLR